MAARDSKHAVISRFSPKSVATRALFIRVSFYLALSDRVLAMKRIQQLFAEYGMEMPGLLEARSARYLNGSIDLVILMGSVITLLTIRVTTWVKTLPITV